MNHRKEKIRYLEEGIGEIYAQVSEKNKRTQVNDDDIFDEEENGFIPLLTWKNITDFYFDANQQIPQISSCVILIEDISRMDMKAQFRMEQFFKDKEGQLVQSDSNEGEAFGRIVFTEALDQRLNQYIKGKSEVYFEI